MRAWLPGHSQHRTALNSQRATISFSTQVSSQTVELDTVNEELPVDYSPLVRSAKNPEHDHLSQACIKQDGLQDDPLVKTLLIQKLCKRGSLRDAHALFDSMPQRPMLAWKSIIRAYVQHGLCLQTLQLFQQLLQEGFVPDKYTFVSVLIACANRTDLSCGLRFHSVLFSNKFSSDVAVATALANMYGKCDSVSICVEMFENMQFHTVIAANILISVHVKCNQWETALFYFFQMQEEGILPNTITFINILSVDLVNSSVLAVGQKLHAICYIADCKVDVALGNALLSLYGKSGCLLHVNLVFDGLLTPNQVSWTTLIEAYNQQEHSRKAFHCFKQMQEQGVLIDRVSYITILETCANMRGLYEGNQVHAQLAGIGLDSNLMIGTALVQMYGDCRCIELAHNLFHSMTHLNLLSWTSWIALQSQHEDGTGTFQAFWQMLQEGFMPDKVVFFSLLDACNKKGTLREGKYVHSFLVGADYELDDNAIITLSQLYLTSRSMEEAKKSFDISSHIGITLWTTMISMCTEHGQDLEALQLFCQMEQEGVLPERLIYINLLGSCANLPSLCTGRQIHTRLAYTVSCSLEAPLINMYSKSGDLTWAQTVFNEAMEHDLISWSALLVALVRHGKSRKALQVVKLLATQNHKSDDFVLLQALLACCHSGLVDEALVCYLKTNRSHPTGIGLDHFCCMIDVFSRAGLLKHAKAFLHAIPCQPSAALWMALLGTSQHKLNVQCAEGLAICICELSDRASGHYVVLSNVYATVSMTEDQHENMG